MGSDDDRGVKGNVDTIVLPGVVEGGDLWQQSFGICAGKWFRLKIRNEGHSTHVWPVAHAIGCTGCEHGCAGLVLIAGFVLYLLDRGL